MLHFANDYTQGACQEILDAVVRTNFENILCGWNYTAIRLSTNWATTEKDLNELVKLL